MVIALPGFPSARDLGGLLTVDGGTTLAGRMVRAGVPGAPSAAQVETARRAGFTLVVDLRTAGEVQAAPHPLAGTEGYRHLPLIDPDAEARRDRRPQQDLAAIYRSSTMRNTATIAAVMTALARAPRGPVLIGCAHGRDRTGMVAAMVLEVAGVTRQAIAEDYLVGDADQRPPAYPRHRSTITTMLEHLDASHGSVAGYLHSLGLSGTDVDRLRDRLRAS